MGKTGRYRVHDRDQVTNPDSVVRMADTMKKGHTLRCCRLLHVRTLAIIIAVLELLFLVYQGLIAVSHITLLPFSQHALAVTVYTLAVLVACVAIALLLLGIFCHIPVLLIPHMLMQSLKSGTPIKLSLVSGFLTGLLVLVVVGYFCAAFINLWCFNVVMDCYRWLGLRLEEKSRALRNSDIPITRLDGKPGVVVQATDF
ncbi:unnamed protein product [Nippostrongylus brasiliensis]|uniref:Transmembrane protein n=1 Tax=Nippostrongylus brasiliensis TaxID=27835 RepID=A0A0N4Y6I0_NIPBR|nr:unnamed protein product [Nippostrongylus brasiliensis]